MPLSLKRMATFQSEHWCDIRQQQKRQILALHLVEWASTNIDLSPNLFGLMWHKNRTDILL
jgi:hypothetical protein